MTNKQQHNARNSIQNMLSLFLFCVGVFSGLAYPTNAAALDYCLYDLEFFPTYRFIDSTYYNKLQRWDELACKAVDDGKHDLDEAVEMMHGIVLRYGICRDERINPDYEKYLKKELKMPDSVVLANKNFCLETFDPNRWDGMKLKVLLKRVDWLRAENFCRYTREVTSPSGFWNNLFQPDLPSIKKFEERTDSICQELRSDKITYNDAIYRWEQEILVYQKKLPVDSVKKVGKSLIKPIKALADMFTNMDE